MGVSLVALFMGDPYFSRSEVVFLLEVLVEFLEAFDVELMSFLSW
uniref:Uncharacterized protein n=1 Tax=Rhizophora mucronata TaxID=61149 RepID=A0A2P2QPN9_RHIMU